jgi:hypothetical protein
MDVTMLANKLVEVLAPFLPTLLRFSKESAAMVRRQFGAEAWDYAEALWDRLGASIMDQPAALEAARDAAAAPDDGDARAALRVQIRKLMEADQTLSSELRSLLDERPGGVDASVTVTSSGDRSIAVGGDAKGSHLMTGDRTPDPG